MRVARIVTMLWSVVMGFGCLVTLKAPAYAAPKRNDQYLLVIPSQGDPKKPRKDDPVPYVVDYLREVLRDVGNHEVATFSPDNPRAKRGVIDHLIDSKDLIQPYSNETLQRFAPLFGANRVLYVVVTETKKGLTASLVLLGRVGQQIWQVLSSDEFSTGEVLGTQYVVPGEKRGGLKIGRKDLMAMLADSIVVRLGLPSQLNERMPSLNAIRINQKPVDTGTLPTNVKKSTPPENTAPKTTGQETGKEPPPTVSKGTPPTPSDPNPAKTVKPNIETNLTPKQTPPPSTKRPTGDITVATDAISLPLNVQRTDSEEQLQHYRQEKDLANVILALRRALNERPNELMLREQLVQAYQDRGMFPMARLEVERAMLLQPESTILRRLYGNILFNQGDVPNALKSYREAIRLDSKNVLAQIALGDALLADNQFKEAFEVYEAAIKNSPDSPIPYRRLARALLTRADTDPKNYAASIDAILKAKAKTPPTDIDGYTEDYIAIMRLMESRIRDMVSDLQNGIAGYKQGKIKPTELNRTLNDMKERAKYAEDYLDSLPPAAGHDPTHAKYQQGAAFLSQAISLFRAYLQDNDAMTETTVRTTLVNANRELNAASTRLNATKPTVPTNAPL